MVQNALKILTLGFFISTITGFVLYRSGYFDSDESSSYLQSSPNGGELMNAQEDQDSTKTPEINQSEDFPILPSSKSGRVFDVEKYEQKKAQRMLPSSKSSVPLFEIGDSDLENPYMYSSKSMTFPVDWKPEFTANQIEDKKREAFRQQPALIPQSDSVTSTAPLQVDSVRKKEMEMMKPKKATNEASTSTPTNWRAIWIGVLGILFVGVGSIVYFKRRSK